MTNEEIEKRAQDLYANIGPDFGHDITEAMRELVLQAYKEAENQSACRYTGAERCDLSDEENACPECRVAARIRALKDPLIGETVP